MNKKLSLISFIFLLGTAAYAVDSTKKLIYPKDKSFCVLETRVDYNSSNDVLETILTCDGDALVSLESVKIEKTDDLKGASRQFTSHVKNMLSEGNKIINCQTNSPVATVRYSTRYSCTFGR